MICAGPEEELYAGVYKNQQGRSIDGQEHEIRSYDEFKQYYNGQGGELAE